MHAAILRVLEQETEESGCQLQSQRRADWPGGREEAKSGAGAASESGRTTAGGKEWTTTQARYGCASRDEAQSGRGSQSEEADWNAQAYYYHCATRSGHSEGGGGGATVARGNWG